MGAGASTLPGGARLGLHVLRVADGSPAADAGIEPFFDFVVAADGVVVNDDTDTFAATIENNEGRSVSLQIWSSKLQELRDVYVVPNRYWSTVNDSSNNADASSSEPSLLGLSLRLCNPEGALDNVWHVLEILDGSPAESAGLVPYGDYILGYAGGVLKGESDFYNLIENHEDKPLRLFVYNHDYDVTREVVIVPNRAWGNGKGLLGCNIGFGLLHRLPHPRTRPAVFEENDLATDSVPQSFEQQYHESTQAYNQQSRRHEEEEKHEHNFGEDQEQSEGLEIIETHEDQPTTPPATSRNNRRSGIYNGQLLSNSSPSLGAPKLSPVGGSSSPTRARSPVNQAPPPPASPSQNALPTTIMEEEEE